MKLVVFDRINQRGNAKLMMRSLSVNRRNAKISFSRRATDEMNITTESQVAFAKDADSKNDWYMCVSQTEIQGGITVRKANGHGNCKDYQILGCTCRALSAEILDSVKAQSGASFLIAEKPVEIDGTQWYQIIISKPIRIN